MLSPEVDEVHVKTAVVLLVRRREDEAKFTQLHENLLLKNEVDLSSVNCLQKLLKLFVLQSKHMKFSEILSDKGTNLQKLNHKKTCLQTIHSTELAFELRHLHVFRKLEAKNK